MVTVEQKRKVWLADATFADLFTVLNPQPSFKPDEKSEAGAVRLVMDRQGRRPEWTVRRAGENEKHTTFMTVGTYLHVRPGHGKDGLMPGHQSLGVQATDKLIDFVCRQMVFIDYDTLHFEVIVFKEVADIYIKHGQIIGSHLLTTVPRRSLPGLIQTVKRKR